MKIKVLLIMLIIGCIFFINVLNNKIKEQKGCYQLLLEEDYIGVGCNKYFITDKWYIEYKKESE